MRRFTLQDLLKVQTPTRHKRRKKRTPLAQRMSYNMAKARRKRSANPPAATTRVAATPPEPPPPTFDLEGCCVDTENMVLVCGEGNALDGAQVTGIETINEQGLASLSFVAPDGVERNTRLPVCESTPPSGCCVDTDAMLIVCTDTSHPLHGAQVTKVYEISDSGLVSFAYAIPGADEKDMRLPLCEVPPEGNCCYDAVRGVLVCDNADDPRHEVSVTLTEIVDGYAYVCGLPGEDSSQNICARFPLCPDTPPQGCCYDAVKGIIVCEDGQAPHGLSPEVVAQPENYSPPVVVVIHPDLNNGNRTVLPLCPEEPPVGCCYDVAKGTLRCPGNPEFDGLEVSLETMGNTPNGTVAVVSHPDLPGGRYQFPICDDGVPEGCCYDGKLKLIVCPGNPELDGTTAGVVVEFTGPDGRPWVSVAWEGGGARMPLCSEECPPSFCCLNLDTGRLVCPGNPTAHDQQVAVQDVITDSYGFNFAVLADGSRVPVCGAKCPPPELCPECPSCPPGMWMTPDKQCVDPPECEPPEGCPPGMWTDPEGVCRRPPKCPKHPPADCPKCPGFIPRPPHGGGIDWPGCLECFCGSCDK